MIVTRLRLGENEWPIEVTLVRRDMMGFRMLLGRQAIRHRCLVDPGRSFLSGKPSEQGPRQRREKPSPTSTPQEGS